MYGVLYKQLALICNYHEWKMKHKGNYYYNTSTLYIIHAESNIIPYCRMCFTLNKLMHGAQLQ